MPKIDVAVIGTGWCGGIRAKTCAANPLVGKLHIAEINPERLAEIANETGAETATADYKDLLKIDEIGAVFISATPEPTHYPIARDCLNAGKHVFLEKPLAMTLEEADELIELAVSNLPSVIPSGSIPNTPTSRRASMTGRLGGPSPRSSAGISPATSATRSRDA